MAARIVDLAATAAPVRFHLLAGQPTHKNGVVWAILDELVAV